MSYVLYRVYTYAKQKTGVTKLANTLKAFDIEFQPFIEEISGKERAIQEYADAATMERIRGIIQRMVLDIMGQF